jgi:hypothetical protein
MTIADDHGMHKYERVMARVRALVEDGTLRPGAPVPSGAALARATGWSVLTCRKALTALIKAGVLVPGPSRNARPRVAGLGSDQVDADTAACELAAELGDRRRVMGLSQTGLAELSGFSVTTIGHAETGRLWQSRRFWERVDAVLIAGGDLLRLHDLYRCATASASFAGDDGGVTAGSAGGVMTAVNGTATVNERAAVVAAGDVNPDPGGIVQALRTARITPPTGQSVSAFIVVWTDGTVETLNPTDGAVITAPAVPPSTQ